MTEDGQRAGNGRRATRLRTAVIGVGKMGAIHAKVYQGLPQSDLVAVVDTDIDKARKLARKYRCSAFADCSELLGKVEAVTIAAPTAASPELQQKSGETSCGASVGCGL